MQNCINSHFLSYKEKLALEIKMHGPRIKVVKEMH
jgi:hypothetical protein